MKRTPVLPWLDPVEQEETCELLLEEGLIKYSNKRDLPLKSEGMTDIYINLREARSSPRALAHITKLFAHALRRLNVPRFAEVPDAVSCFAGPLALELNLPYITIREEAKAGRVTKGKIVGAFRKGEDIAIIDDVITDGESKIIPYEECRKRGLQPVLVVLVDRQQGWREKFDTQSVTMGVWPGMTLHDVRRYLISQEIMQRCDKEIEARNPLIVALDGKSWEETLLVIDSLRTTGCIFKVNDLLLNMGIENLIPNLQIYGRVMADMKGHDIPHTLENISKHFLKHPPWAITVHASGGEHMLRGAVEILKETETEILAVTVLTSMDATTSEEIYTRKPLEQVKKLAEIAKRAGVHGFVCSPEELSYFRSDPQYYGMTLVTPGIRSEGMDTGDQKRTATPQEAIATGAQYIVMGRQIIKSHNPAKEVRRILGDELGYY